MEDLRSYVVIVDGVVTDTFAVPASSKEAGIREVTGLNDISIGDKFNPATQAFYCDIDETPSSEI